MSTEHVGVRMRRRARAATCTWTDVAAAFDVILHKGIVGETYNIGTQKVRMAASRMPPPHAHLHAHLLPLSLTIAGRCVGPCLCRRRCMPAWRSTPHAWKMLWFTSPPAPLSASHGTRNVPSA